MKRLYFRPSGVSRPALVLIALLAVAALLAVETFRIQTRQSHYDEKMAAARLAQEAFRVVKSERLRRNVPIDAQIDPAQSGLIGTSISHVTSNTGYLSAKRTSVNPNFAAVVVDYLKKAGARRGDVIAVGISGSFPALNLAAFAALQTLGLKPIVIASAASSEWGANNPELTWLDMEQTLVERGVFSFRSVAASRGGIDDRGFGMTEEGQVLLDRTIQQYGLKKLEGSSLKESIDQRMALYEELAESRPIKAYINIGGGSASVGTHVGKKQLKPGLNVEAPHGPNLVDSVMLRFIQQGVAVIHVSDISKLARRYGFPLEPARIPKLGEGTVYARAEYNRWLAFVSALAVFAGMLAFTRLDIGLRILRQNRPTERAEPQQMI